MSGANASDLILIEWGYTDTRANAQGSEPNRAHMWLSPAAVETIYPVSVRMRVHVDSAGEPFGAEHNLAGCQVCVGGVTYAVAIPSVELGKAIRAGRDCGAFWCQLTGALQETTNDTEGG